MRLSIYIHQDRLDVIKMYGNVSQFVDRMLKAYDEGLIDIENKPECESREGANRCEVNVTNETYLNLLEIHGVKSKRLSLRRLLYWFIDNEVYNELGWEPVNSYTSSIQDKLNKYVDKTLMELDRLRLFCKTNRLSYYFDCVEEARQLINTMRCENDV